MTKTNYTPRIEPDSKNITNWINAWTGDFYIPRSTRDDSGQRPFRETQMGKCANIS